MLTPSRRTPEPSNRSDAVALLKRLAVGHAVVDRHPAKTDRTLVFARQVELAGEQARHRVIVDLERVAQGLDVAAHDANTRVDFLAAVVSREPEREQPFGSHLRPSLSPTMPSVTVT